MSKKLTLKYIPLTELKEWEENPKQHDVETIAESILRFGFRDPEEVDPTSNRLLAGHGRVKALWQLYSRWNKGEIKLPAHIVLDKTEWLIPAVTGQPFDSDSEAEAYLLANNKTSALGGYDSDKLRDMLGRVQKTNKGLLGTAFSETDVASIMSRARSTLADITGVANSTPREISEHDLAELPSPSQGEPEFERAPQTGMARPTGNLAEAAKELGRPLMFHLDPDSYTLVYNKLVEYQHQHQLDTLSEALIKLVEESC
jgi:hypothetical protein